MTSSETTEAASSDIDLGTWLEAQADKLKNLNANGYRLKLDFVQNASDKGEILIEIKKRLAETSESFEKWVTDNTDIGYSTALLYMDVAKNFETVKEKFAHSNGVEASLRQVRDAIRDARHERGGGKPGSGRKPIKSASPPPPQPGDDEVGDGSDQEDADDTDRWERQVAKAEGEAAVVDGKGKTTPDSPLYKLTVMVFTEPDQEAMFQALLNWSPVKKTPQSAKQWRSVSAGVGPSDIGRVLDNLGKTLEQNPPKRLRVSIQL